MFMQTLHHRNSYVADLKYLVILIIQGHLTIKEWISKNGILSRILSDKYEK